MPTNSRINKLCNAHDRISNRKEDKLQTRQPKHKMFIGSIKWIEHLNISQQLRN